MPVDGKPPKNEIYIEIEIFLLLSVAWCIVKVSALRVAFMHLRSSVPDALRAGPRLYRGETRGLPADWDTCTAITATWNSYAPPFWIIKVTSAWLLAHSCHPHTRSFSLPLVYRSQQQNPEQTVVTTVDLPIATVVNLAVILFCFRCCYAILFCLLCCRRMPLLYTAVNKQNRVCFCFDLYDNQSIFSLFSKYNTV